MTIHQEWITNPFLQRGANYVNLLQNNFAIIILNLPTGKVMVSNTKTVFNLVRRPFLYLQTVNIAEACGYNELAITQKAVRADTVSCLNLRTFLSAFFIN